MQGDSIPETICIGAAVWDFAGQVPCRIHPGSDVAGRIVQRPGGVALNIAMTLSQFGLRSVLLTSIGNDPEGVELLERCRSMGLLMDHVHISGHLPTDRCLIVEDVDRMVALVADIRSLADAGDRILHPIIDGTFGSSEIPYLGVIVIDGNLDEALLARIAKDPSFSAADLRVVCASPGKANRLFPLLRAPNATFYLNLEEASTLCGRRFTSSEEAASMMRRCGVARVLVTDGARTATDSGPEATIMAAPPEVTVARFSGAGDSLVAAHVAAEASGADRESALHTALSAAAAHVSKAEST